MKNRCEQANINFKELLADLINVLEKGNCLSLGLTGSTSHKKLDYVSDLDVLVVVEKMNKTIYKEILKASRSVCTTLADKTGRQWLLEDRQSPLKPMPNSSSQQLHLCLHDKTSLTATSPAMSLLYLSKSILIWGVPLDSLVSPPLSAYTIVQSCIEEISLAKDALRSNLIITKNWFFSDKPCIVQNRIKTENSWSRRCLLRNCSAIADRLCIEALSFYPMILLPFVTERPTIYEEIKNDLKNWKKLNGPRWKSVKRKVQTLLDEHAMWLKQAVIAVGESN